MEPIKPRNSRVNPQSSAVIVHPGAPAQAHAVDLYDQSYVHSLHAIAGGAAQIAESVQKSNDQDAAAWASRTLSQARLDWTKNFLQRKEAAESSPAENNSFEDFTPKLLEDFDKYADGIVSKAPSKHSGAYLSERLSAMRGELGTQALTFEANARIDARTDNLTAAIRNRGQILALDPSQFGVALAEQRAEINASPLPPIQKSKLLAAASDTLAREAVASQIQKSPVNFLQSIGFLEGPTGAKLRRASGDLKEATGNQPFDLLGFDDRLKAIDSAIKQKNQIDTDGDRTAALQRKTLGDNAMKDGWDLFFGGKLTETYIKSIKQLVSESDYKSLYTALNGGAPTHSDPAVLSDVYRLVDANKFDEARRLVYTAHHNHRLKNEGSDGFTGLISHVDSFEKHDGPKTQYESSREYIKTAMDPGQGVPDMAGRGRLAEALRDFDLWVRNTKPKDADLDERARELVRQYKLIDFRDMVFMLPQPRGSTITRQHTDTDKMENEIKGALLRIDNDTRMKPAEKDFEIAKLKRWRDAMEAARDYAKR